MHFSRSTPDKITNPSLVRFVASSLYSANVYGSSIKYSSVKECLFQRSDTDVKKITNELLLSDTTISDA